MTLTIFSLVAAFLSLGNPDNNQFQTAEEKRVQFEGNIKSIYNDAHLEEYDLDYKAFRFALVGYYNLRSSGALNKSEIVSIIDFNKPSNEKRFYTIDLASRKLIYHELVSHGQGTGDLYAQEFSNQFNSHQSSLGFYVTGETYVGKHGLSLRLDGMDYGWNHNARPRAVVMHKADYVNEQLANSGQRIGRSWGCPALRNEICEQVINTVKDKTVIFAYYNNSSYLKSTKFNNLANAIKTALDKNPVS